MADGFALGNAAATGGAAGMMCSDVADGDSASGSYHPETYHADGAGLPVSVSIFADRPVLRLELGEDARVAGLRLGRQGTVADLLEAEAGAGARIGVGAGVAALSDIVLVDCPEAGGAALAALARLDLRAAHCGAQLVVSTTVAALDDVFGCLDRSDAQLLVAPNRADRAIALGRAMARLPGRRLRELSEQDRLTLLRLTEQVGQIAERLDRLSAPIAGSQAGPQVFGDLVQDNRGTDSVFRFESPRRGFSGADKAGLDGDGSDRLVRASRPPLPDPRLVRRIIRQRQLRARFFDGDLFADPAWDMLLDLTAARAEHARVSVTSLCIASAVPPTTALRWIGQMIEAGLFQRVEDEVDRRRAFIALSDRAAEGMARYFAELGSAAGKLV